MVAILVCINKEETWHSAPFTLGCVTSEQDSNMFQFTIYSVAKQVWWNLKPVRCADKKSCVPAYIVSSERTPSDLQPLLKPPPVPPCWSLLQHPLTHHLILTGLFFLLSSLSHLLYNFFSQVVSLSLMDLQFWFLYYTFSLFSLNGGLVLHPLQCSLLGRPKSLEAVTRQRVSQKQPPGTLAFP